MLELQQSSGAVDARWRDMLLCADAVHTPLHAGTMANVKISPLSFQSDPESKLPSGTMSGPVTDAASPPPAKRSKAARMCGCFVEVQFKTAKWLYFVGFVIQCIVSWVFRWALLRLPHCAPGHQHGCEHDYTL